jgi:molybdopterin/thiamine biosynthesis adenylyltransferase
LATPDPLYDRQVRAFGPVGQAVIADLRVGIVGAGGTGSAVAEQLIRLGVRNITSLDPDSLTGTNVTRVYGSSVEQVDLPKVDVLRTNAERIGLGTVVSTHCMTLSEESSLNLLAHCDVVFGCTDDHAGRGWLTRLPGMALNTLIDCGVVIDSIDQRVNEIFGRVTTVVPGSACLFCTNDIDPAKVRTDSLDADEYDRQRREGYAPELDTRVPAVVVYTTLVASLAVGEMIDRFIVHGLDEPPNQLHIRALERRIGHRHIDPRPGHWCSQ